MKAPKNGRMLSYVEGK
jgi:hypothetical protein